MTDKHKTNQTCLCIDSWRSEQYMSKNEINQMKIKHTQIFRTDKKLLNTSTAIFGVCFLLLFIILILLLTIDCFE